MAKEPYVRLVSLWIRPGQSAAFEAFEREAAGIRARHGGRIELAVRIADGGGDAPYEVHLVTFPHRRAADSYAADPETAELRLRRAAIIARTEVLEGSFAGPY